jgi:hypothetical protein
MAYMAAGIVTAGDLGPSHASAHAFPCDFCSSIRSISLSDVTACDQCRYGQTHHFSLHGAVPEVS